MLRSARPSLPVITFSHFVPRADLLPDYERLKFKELIDVSVSDGLELLIREAGAVVHVFGHTHIPVKKVTLNRTPTPTHRCAACQKAFREFHRALSAPTPALGIDPSPQPPPPFAFKSTEPLPHVDSVKS